MCTAHRGEHCELISPGTMLLHVSTAVELCLAIQGDCLWTVLGRAQQREHAVKREKIYSLLAQGGRLSALTGLHRHA